MKFYWDIFFWACQKQVLRKGEKEEKWKGDIGDIIWLFSFIDVAAIFAIFNVVSYLSFIKIILGNIDENNFIFFWILFYILMVVAHYWYIYNVIEMEWAIKKIESSDDKSRDFIIFGGGTLIMIVIMAIVWS